jgi:hypothetical protein
MAAIADLERLLERVFERTSARLFRSRVQAVQVERRLERAMEAGRTGRGASTVVPNRFRVRLHISDLRDLAERSGGPEALAADLADQALAFARLHGYHLVARPTVSVVTDPAAERGMVEVDASVWRPTPTPAADGAGTPAVAVDASSAHAAPESAAGPSTPLPPLASAPAAAPVDAGDLASLVAPAAGPATDAASSGSREASAGRLSPRSVAPGSPRAAAGAAFAHDPSTPGAEPMATPEGQPGAVPSDEPRVATPRGAVRPDALAPDGPSEPRSVATGAPEDVGSGVPGPGSPTAEPGRAPSGASIAPGPSGVAGSRPGGIRHVGAQPYAVRPAAPPPARALLRVTEPGGHEREVKVEGQPLTMGRAPDNGLVLRDARVSRHHGRFVNRHGALVYTDLGSTNGTRVNGIRVDEFVLGAGDRLQVGDVVVVVEQLPG